MEYNSPVLRLCAAILTDDERMACIETAAEFYEGLDAVELRDASAEDAAFLLSIAEIQETWFSIEFDESGYDGLMAAYLTQVHVLGEVFQRVCADKEIEARHNTDIEKMLRNNGIDRPEDDDAENA